MCTTWPVDVISMNTFKKIYIFENKEDLYILIKYPTLISLYKICWYDKYHLRHDTMEYPLYTRTFLLSNLG